MSESGGMGTRAVTTLIIEDLSGSPQDDNHARHLKVSVDRSGLTGDTTGSAMAIESGKFFFIVTRNSKHPDCFTKPQYPSANQKKIVRH
jgi:hypothetical protein